MIVAGVVLMLASPSVGSSGEPFEQITAQVAASRITQCGLGPVSIRFDELLQSEVLTADNAHGVSDEQLSCADRAASYFFLELPPAVQARYDAIRTERLSVHFVAEARAWLSERGLLGRLPHYQAGVTDDAEFTQAVEDLCGPSAKGAFQSEYGFHAISPDWATRVLSPLDRESIDTFACIMNVTRVAGYDVSLIGNEASSAE